MTTLSAAKAREHFSDVVNQVGYGKKRIILTRHNKEIAVIVPFEDLELLQLLEDYDDLRSALTAVKESHGEGKKSLAQLKKELGL